MNNAIKYFLFFMLLFSGINAFATTWYVRPDGGTRYSAFLPTGQCDGTGDAAYPGTGVNQHCAYIRVAFLWQDGSYQTSTSAGYPGYGWIGASGDTYIIRGSIGTGVSYRVGWPTGSGAGDPILTGLSFGIQGDPNSSGAPFPISGTSGAHTKILGENFASCHTLNAKTQLHGGFGTGTVIPLQGVNYVDIACLDITDFSSCGKAGQTNTCNTTIGSSMDDFTSDGISINRGTTNTTLTDIRIHGMASAGIFGPTGDGVVLNYIELLGNASSGWNADPNDGSTGTGNLLISNFNISWNGCAEQYGSAAALPYADCTDDGVSGYGDGFGTATYPSIPAWNAHFDNGIVSYNTQDGLDALHLNGAGSSMTISRTLAYGNMSQQIKIGGARGIATNNVIFGNCNALRYAIPGTITGYNSRLSNFCRAGDEGIVLTVAKGTTAVYTGNTLYSANNVAIEIPCDSSAGGCDSTSLIDYRDNIFHGYAATSANGYAGSQITNVLSAPFNNDSGVSFFTNAGSLYSNNVTFNQKPAFTCPQPGETNYVCTDPLLTNGTWPVYGTVNVQPNSSSIINTSGQYISAMPIDFLGVARVNPTTIGAYQFVGGGGGSTYVYVNGLGNQNWTGISINSISNQTVAPNTVNSIPNQGIH